MSGRPGLSRSILFRALLGAISVVLAVLPAIVAVGAFVPSIPTVGRFSALAVTHLPALLLEACAAAAIAVTCLALGGGRWTRLLAGITVGTMGAMVAVAAVTSVFAWRLGVPFDVFHMARAAAEAPSPDERVVFATVEGIDLHADIWRAAAPGAATAGGGPAVLYVHGGAFISGDLGSRPDLFEAVAGAGITVVDVEYRLSGPPRWEHAPADVMCALGWMRAQAGALGIDASKIVVVGESAGGNLAMLAGYAAGTGEIESSCGGSPVPPAGVFAIAPTADLEGIWADRTISALDRPFPEAYIGGTPSQYPERYAAASPFRLLHPDLPPTFLLTGANDHFVLPNRVTSVADRIAAAGAEVTLVVAPFADHGFDGFPNGYGNQLQRVLLPRFVMEVTG